MKHWQEQVERTISWNRRLGYKAYRVKAFRDWSGRWYYYMVGEREYR